MICSLMSAFMYLRGIEPFTPLERCQILVCQKNGGCYMCKAVTTYIHIKGMQAKVSIVKHLLRISLPLMHTDFRAECMK